MRTSILFGLRDLVPKNCNLRNRPDRTIQQTQGTTIESIPARSYYVLPLKGTETGTRNQTRDGIQNGTDDRPTIRRKWNS